MIQSRRHRSPPDISHLGCNLNTNWGYTPILCELNIMPMKRCGTNGARNYQVRSIIFRNLHHWPHRSRVQPVCSNGHEAMSEGHITRHMTSVWRQMTAYDMAWRQYNILSHRVTSVWHRVTCDVTYYSIVPCRLCWLCWRPGASAGWVDALLFHCALTAVCRTWLVTTVEPIAKVEENETDSYLLFVMCIVCYYADDAARYIPQWICIY